MTDAELNAKVKRAIDMCIVHAGVPLKSMLDADVKEAEMKEANADENENEDV